MVNYLPNEPLSSWNNSLIEFLPNQNNYFAIKQKIKNNQDEKLLFILIALPMIGFGQNVNIPDSNFKAYLVGEPTININGDTESK